MPSQSSTAPHPALASAASLRARFAAPDADLLSRMLSCYGDAPELLRERAAAAVRTLDRFLEAYGDRPCALYRAPARISLNPHSDHQGAWVPYGLHHRELLAVVAPVADDDRVEAVNVDPRFADRLSFSLSEEAGRDAAAWAEGWLAFVDSPAVAQAVRDRLDHKAQDGPRHSTINYLKAGALRMRHLHAGTALPGLRLALHGNIPQGGGQSSSSTLVVVAALALLELAGLPVERERLAEQCGEAEWFVGTRGGSGDHAAILLGSREGLTHLCFRAPFGIRGVRRSAFPAGYQLLLANSQTRSEKSAEQRLLFNRGIFAYRFAFLALRAALPALGYDAEFVAATESLGDLHTGRIAEADLYRLLLALPEHVSPRELAQRFPHVYPAAARGCFGTDDPERLPADIPLRGAAVYGLGRVDRGRHMPALLEDGSGAAMAEFGRLMSITHDGDRLFLGGRPYTDGQARQSDGALRAAVAAVEGGDPRPLREEPGVYGASIEALDRMVDVVERVGGVLGAGLMGAGGGGYVLVLARRGAEAAIHAELERGYYRPTGREPDIEAWHPADAACRLA